MTPPDVAAARARLVAWQADEYADHSTRVDDIRTLLAATNPHRNAGLRAAITKALKESEVLFCTRAWEAWHYKTMTDEDFMDASEVADVVDALVAAASPIATAAPALDVAP